MALTLRTVVKDWRRSLYEDGLSATAGPITEMIEKAINYDDAALENAKMLIEREIMEELNDPMNFDLPVIPYVNTTLENLRILPYYNGQQAAMENGVIPTMNELGRREDRLREVQESLVHTALDTVHECGFNPNQRNMNEITPFCGGDSFQVEPENVAVRTVGAAICDIIEAESDEDLDAAMIRFAQITEAIEKRYGAVEDEAAMEDVGARVRQGARDARNAVRSGIRKADKAVGDAKRTVKKVIDPMEKFIEKATAKIKEADREERREIILKGGDLPKIKRWLNRAIPLAIGSAVGTQIPIAAVLSAIAFLGWIATDKYLDDRERHDIIGQLQDEIEIVNEKLDDSRGDMNKQKKYELMRIRNKLRRTKDKVQYRLNIRTDDDLVQTVSKSGSPSGTKPKPKK